MPSVFQTIDVVIDETYAPDPSVYTISTFLDNIKAPDNSSFPFLANGKLWRYDKRIRDAAPLGKLMINTAAKYKMIDGSHMGRCSEIWTGR